MKAKLIVEGKEFEIDILDSELEKLVKPKKKTGYERVEEGQTYWVPLADGNVSHHTDYPGDINNSIHFSANYYSDKTIAKNNARADKLMRQLRRFAVVHRKEEIDWSNCYKRKYNIYFDYSEKDFFVNDCLYVKDLFGIYFDSEETANLLLKLSTTNSFGTSLNIRIVCEVMNYD